MPRILDSINTIASQLQRDVLFLTFCRQAPHAGSGMFADEAAQLPDWENNPARQAILLWLDEAGIPFRECYGVWPEGLILAPYDGTVYLDIPHDPELPQYRKLADFLEDEHGRTRHDGVGFHLFRWTHLPRQDDATLFLHSRERG